MQREFMGLTHADVAAHLNLRISIIEAIEDDNYKNIPKLVFARGYLRSYAKLLNIPGNEIIDAFNKLECPENPSEHPATPLRDGQKKPVKKEHSFIPWIAFVVLLVLFAGVGFWQQISSFLTHASSQTIVAKPQSSAEQKAVEPQSKQTVVSPVALPDLDHFKQEN